MSQSVKSAACGAWRSPIDAEMLAAQTVRLGGVAIDAADALWLEGRPTEGGRNALVRAPSAGASVEQTPAPWNVRSRVHEYGGGAFAVRDGTVWFANDDDQRLYRLDPDGDHALRVQVVLGRASVETVEIINGLSEGDRVILSDTSRWDENEKIRLR